MAAAALDSDRQGGHRLFWALVAALFVCAAWLRAEILMRSVEVLDGRTLDDDSYYVFEIARNWATGRGPSWGDGPTNGFQVLWTVLLLPVFGGLAPNAELAELDAAATGAMIVGAVVDLCAMLVLARLLWRRLGPSPAVAFGLAVWAFDPFVIATALNGLETTLAVVGLLVVASVVEACGDGYDVLRAAGLGAALGVATLCRIDALLLLPIVVYVVGRAPPSSPGSRLLRIGALAGGLVATYGPWWIYARVITGLGYPISGRAVRLQALSGPEPDLGFWLERFALAFRSLESNLGPLGWLAGAGLLVLASSRRGRARRIAAQWRAGLHGLGLLIVHPLVLLAVYPVYLPAFWAYQRYLFPVVLVAVLTVAIGLHVLLRTADGSFAPRAWMLAAALGAALGLVRPGLHDLRRGPPDLGFGYRGFALWAEDTLPAGSSVGSTQTGALGYYGESLQVVNLDGVVDARSYEALVQGRILEDAASRGVEYVVGWTFNVDYLRTHSGPAAVAGLELLGEAPVRSRGYTWSVYRLSRPAAGSLRTSSR